MKQKKCKVVAVVTKPQLQIQKGFIHDTGM